MDMGINVKNDANKPDQGFFVTAKSKLYPILAVDEKGSPINVKVANGSKGVALIKPYNYNVGGGLADWSLNQGDCIQFVYAGSISKWIKIN